MTWNQGVERLERSPVATLYSKNFRQAVPAPVTKQGPEGQVKVWPQSFSQRSLMAGAPKSGSTSLRPAPMHHPIVPKTRPSTIVLHPAGDQSLAMLQATSKSSGSAAMRPLSIQLLILDLSCLFMAYAFFVKIQLTIFYYLFG